MPESTGDILFFGYYTSGSPYEQEFRGLEMYFKRLGLDYEYVGIPNRGSWMANTQAKADIVADFLARYPGRRLCYVDVDSVILSKPEQLWTIDADIAAVMFAGSVLLSGVVLFQSNPATVACVERWRELNAQYPVTLPDGREAWDQRTLLMAIRETQTRFATMPPAYNYIGDLSAEQYPGVVPVILATRGSTRFREQIDAAGAAA